MAPREATGTFPDQFLTFDYDVSLNLGVGGPPPPPAMGLDTAAAVAAAATMMENNNLTAAAGDNLTNISPAGTTATAVQTGQSRPGHGGGGDDNNNNESTAPVDPLSIDPTLNQDMPLFTAPSHTTTTTTTAIGTRHNPLSHQVLGGAPNHQHGHFSSMHQDLSTQSTILRLPQMPQMDHSAALPPPPPPQAAAGPQHHHHHHHHHPPPPLRGNSTVTAVPVGGSSLHHNNHHHSRAISMGGVSVGGGGGGGTTTAGVAMATMSGPNDGMSVSSMASAPTPPGVVVPPAGGANALLTSSSSHLSFTPRVGRHSRRSSTASSLSSHSHGPTNGGSRRNLFGGPQPAAAAAAAASSVTATSVADFAAAAATSSLLDQSTDAASSVAPTTAAAAAAASSTDAGNGNDVSLEIDDMGPAPPGLDITYDSLATSYTQSQGSWEDDDEDDEDNNNDDDDMAKESPQHMQQQQQQQHLPTVSPILVNEEEDDQSQPSPMNVSSSNASATSATSSYSSLRIIHQTSAFDMSGQEGDVTSNGGASNNNVAVANPQQQQAAPTSPSGMVSPPPVATPASPNSIMLSFGPNTSVSDLKYFAERGCIVALLQALTTPRLVTLGTRMLADYAKMSHRRVAVASNRRILEFVQQTMLQMSEQADWLGREYAVETVRSLTATEESDRYLMGTEGLLKTLALVARGGPFVTHIQENGTRMSIPLASEKARLHACIAIMNLSCGKANKIEIAKVPDVLEAMRDVMLHSSDEARLKATTCIKNLSNADANDAALLGTPGLVEALGHVAAATCTPDAGATPCTTNACLALMNLSISKVNKHRVFRTPGVMDALMIVLERTTAQGSSTEARIKACSALSNLAIGYDNKIPMFNYPGFVDAILNVIQTDRGEARTKACSILWSFAAEMKNQVPVVQRGDILPVLVRVAEEDGTTEARFKCVAALTLLAESLENAIPLLESGALAPLMDILHEAGPDPTQWKGQTASWCVGFLMNIAQSDEAVPTLREAGVVELLAPLLTLDHYQSLKAAMAVTFVCRYDEGDECYDLLRKTENVIPKIISLLHNTLSGRGGNGYKYGVFTLRSSVGCISALACGPDFMKERIATGPVFESLLRVLSDFCVDGGTPGAIVGGGRDDVMSATLAVRALQSLTEHLIPIAGCSALPFGQSMEERLLTALASCESSTHPNLKAETRALATDAKVRIQGSQKAGRAARQQEGNVDVDMTDVASFASNCCGLDSLPGFGDRFLGALSLPSTINESKTPVPELAPSSSMVDDSEEASPPPVRTFLLADSRTGRRFAVPCDPSGGRSFNDNRVWCYRRGRFCQPGEQPDPNFAWTENLQRDYEAAVAKEQEQAQQSQQQQQTQTSSTPPSSPTSVATSNSRRSRNSSMVSSSTTM